METGPVVRGSSFTRWVRTAYGARVGRRSSGAGRISWVGAIGAVALFVMISGSSPWTWLALPIVVLLLWLPFVVRWSVAIVRSVGGFREGYRSEDGTTASAR